MKNYTSSPRPSWRAAESRSLRPELWLIAAALLGVMLVEVWQSARVTALCAQLDRTHRELKQANATLEYRRAELDRASQRAELVPVAGTFGLAPLDAKQVVDLPVAYLERDRERTADAGTPLLATLGRAARVLVPQEATARGRNVN